MKTTKPKTNVAATKVCALLVALGVLPVAVPAAASATATECGETRDSWYGTFKGDQYQAGDGSQYVSTFTLKPVRHRVDWKITHENGSIVGAADGHDDWWIEKTVDGYHAVFRSDGGRGIGPISDFRLTAATCNQTGHVSAAKSVSVMRGLSGEWTITSRDGFPLKYQRP
jgi:hypothetical protein